MSDLVTDFRSYCVENLDWRKRNSGTSHLFLLPDSDAPFPTGSPSPSFCGHRSAPITDLRE